MTIITEDMLRGLDEMIVAMSDDTWDMPPALFILTDQSKLGFVHIDEMFFEQYPDPIELFNKLAELQRNRVNELKQTGQTYVETNPELMEQGRAVAIVGVVESYGMVDAAYRQAVRALTPERRHYLIKTHGYIPMQDLEGASEQRNIIAVDKDLNVTMLSRHRQPEKVEFLSEGEGGMAGGRLSEALVSFLGAILACYPPEMDG